MDILKKECIANVTLFDLRLSEGELMVYADCMRIIKERLCDSEISPLTVCESKEEPTHFLEDMLDTPKLVERQEYVPDRFK
ncbi:hypothetical protein VRB78_11300 [Pseudomonas trivialis]|uniref:hypothetical protein n=1 Tax=Pseudomonas trivialis TaxID=200450 RepID=UPI0030CACB63